MQLVTELDEESHLKGITMELDRCDLKYLKSHIA